MKKSKNKLMKYIVSFALILICYTAQSQQYKYAYYFNEKLEPVSKDQALIIGRGVKTSGGVTVDFFAVKTGRKLFTTDFTDSTLNYMEGRNVEYDNKGRPVKSNYYKNNVIDGLMQKWDASGRMTDSIMYSEGKVINKTEFIYNKDGMLVNYKLTDNVNDKLNVVFFDTESRKNSEVLFTGDKGVWNYYKEGNIYKTDSVFTREEVDASYPGGSQGWRRYLESNLDAAIPVRMGAPAGNHTVVIQFAVDTVGKISDIKALTSIGYGTEDEAIRVIKKSGKWIPAVQFGKKVKAYRKQPFTFQIFGQNKQFDNSRPAERPYGL